MTDKYIIVTGCDSGFGLDLVTELARKRVMDPREPRVVACCHNESSIPELPSGAIGTVLDITVQASVEKLRVFIDCLLAENPGSSLVALVNNAGGLVSSGPLEWASVDMDIQQMDLNFFGTLRVTKVLLPYLRETRGRIVNVSSVMGFVAAPLGASYSASKFALEGWSDALRREMLPFGVTVHVIQPGMVSSTNFYDKYISSVDMAWKGTGMTVKNAYGETYKEYSKLRLLSLHKLFAARSTKHVVDAMIHALSSSGPKHRYRVGWDSRFLGEIIPWLPASLCDLALTVSDPLLMLSVAMIPVMPTKGLANVWAIMDTSLRGYAQTWIIVSVVVLLLAVVKQIIIS